MNARTFEDATAEVGGVWPKPRGVPGIEPDALDCWSVTAILGTLNKYGLNIWFQNQVALTAYARREALAVLTEDEAVSLLTSQRNWQRPDHELSDRDLGSEVHRVVESMILDVTPMTPHPEAVGMVAQFRNWFDHFKPRFLAAEMTVYDPTYLYAGTADAVVEFEDGSRWLIDWKTSRKSRDAQGHVRSPYPEWSLQLAAYRFAPYAIPARVDVAQADERSPRHYYITPEQQSTAVPMPKVDGCAIVQLTPDEWRVWPVRVEDDAHDAFLFLREVSRFVEVIARKSVFGSYVEGKA